MYWSVMVIEDIERWCERASDVRREREQLRMLAMAWSSRAAPCHYDVDRDVIALLAPLASLLFLLLISLGLGALPLGLRVMSALAEPSFDWLHLRSLGSYHVALFVRRTFRFLSVVFRHISSLPCVPIHVQ